MESNGEDKMDKANKKQQEQRPPKDWTPGCAEEKDYKKWRRKKLLTDSKYL